MPRPVREAEHRLFRFNESRDRIVAQVTQRVVARRVAASARGSDASLEYILNDAAFQEIQRLEKEGAGGAALESWRALSRRLGKLDEGEKRKALEDLVSDLARDVVGSFDPRIYRVASKVMPAFLTGLLSPQSLREGFSGLAELGGHVRVEGPIDHVRACAEMGTLILVPTHSSNLDSVVLGWSLYHTGLPPVTYGAGKNLFANKFLGFFMRNLGAYRVDRRIKHSLYKDVLKEYSTVLLEHGFHSLFFPGGTRSRSGKVEEHLKLGLLGTGLTAYANNVAAGAPQKRIFIVPITINYSVVLEAETLIEDYLAEAGKQRYIIEDDEFSRLSRLVEYGRKMLALDGPLVIRYGAPLDPFGNPVNDGGESLDPRGRVVDPVLYLTGTDGALASDGQRDAEYTRGLGRELEAAYRRLTVLMPTNILARALWDRLVAREGTADVYRLLRAGAPLRVPIETVRADVDALRRRLEERPALGRVSKRFAGGRPGDLVDEGLIMFKGYHRRPAARREGDDVVASDLRLLLYYQNRTAHIGGAS